MMRGKSYSPASIWMEKQPLAGSYDQCWVEEGELMRQAGTMAENSKSSERTTRCPVCDWPMAESRESGCVPDDCSYRPEQGSPEWHRIQKRRAAISAGNQTQDKREC